MVAAASGEAQIQLFIIFPLISGTSLLFVLGVVLIVASFVLGFVLAATSMHEQAAPDPMRSTDNRLPQSGERARQKTKYGGVVLIGPVPIVFGSDRKIAWAMLVVAIGLLAIVLAIALLRL